MRKLVAIFKNKDVRERIFFTLGIMLIFRIGASITVPGVNIEQEMDTGNVLSLMNLLGGGALQSFSLFALGVSPYITAQIITQLLQMDIVPYFKELKEQGYQKFDFYLKS